MHRHTTRTHRFWRLLAANFYDLRLLLRDSRFSLLGFSALSAIGTVYLIFGYNDYPQGVPQFTPLSALFETLRMLVLQSGLPLPRNDRLGQLLFFMLPLLGLALVFQSVMNFGRYLFDKGSRRQAWQVALASTYRNHVIVCGLGRVGYRAMRQLVDTGYEVVVIEHDWNSEFVGATLALGVPVVLGDARQSNILCQAGLRRAKGLLAAISNDLLNLEVALTAREQQPTLNVVLRIFDDAIDSNIERCFGRNTTFSSSALAAPTLAAAAVTRDIAHVLVQGDQLIGVAEINVQPNSQITGPVRAVEERLDVRVLLHTRGGQPIASSTDVLSGGDCVTLLGSLEALEQLRLHNQAGSKLDVRTRHPFQAPATHRDTVIVCGLGKVGFRVIMQLSQLPHRPQIVLITAHNTRDQFLKAVEALGVRIVVGDARIPEVLREAGIDSAYSVAAVTGHDLLNIQISLAARQQREDIHVVLRVFSEVMAERLDVLFGLHTAYSAAGLAAPALAAGSVLRGLSNAVRVGDQLFAQINLTVQPGSLLVGRTVMELRAGENALVIAIGRDERTFAPQLDTSLRSGDEIALLAPLPVLARLQANTLHRTPASAPQPRSEAEEMVLH